ncbi:histidine--tRNA ligase [Spirochaetia bacterium]|nr:histidine--tRNA ligase [Spirochaetia bacterium]
MQDFIQPRVLKGFRDFLPQDEILKRTLVENVENVFRKFGFLPIDTPALEYTEILLGKGGGETEKQVYRFTDNGGRDVSLRFDLTVPFARFAAEHRGELTFPFKRYHIAKVWRGENTQRGRYREFTQCDFDCVGSNTAACDFEILLMMKEALAACGAGNVKIKVNHRGMFNNFLKKIGMPEKLTGVLRAVDKLDKIGREEVFRALGEITDSARAEEILNFIGAKSTWEETLDAMIKASGGTSEESERLSVIRKYMIDCNVEDSFVLDPSITRGLDYYTGIVFETFLAEMSEIGSVCSGGRYDNLTGLYSKEPLSGVGASVGLDRLIAAIDALGKTQKRKTYAPVFIACLDEAKTGLYQQLALKLRNSNIACEVSCEAKKLTAQFMLAEKKGASYVIIPNEEDPLNGKITLRDLTSRQNREAYLSSLIDFLKALK